MMTSAYIRDAASRLLNYFQALERAEPGGWTEQVRIAKDFVALTQEHEDRWSQGASRLRRRVAVLDGNGTAMLEVDIALRQMEGERTGGRGGEP
ncbi:MAG: hypothetical protein AAF411_04410 [Myxococcota bacterium]